MTHTTQNEECKHNTGITFNGCCPQCHTFIENQHNNEEWEIRFDETFGRFYHEGEKTDFTSEHIKEFIRQQRQEAVKEFAEQLKMKFNNLFIHEPCYANKHYIEKLETYRRILEDMQFALEVYEGK